MQRLMTDSPTQETLEETIIKLITNGDNDEAIEAIFTQDPNRFFAGENVKNFLTCAREAGHEELISILISQYAADKYRLGEWEKLVRFKRMIANYHAEYNELDKAKSLIEYSLFYLQKQIDANIQEPALLEQKLALEKLLADLCSDHLIKLEEDKQSPVDLLLISAQQLLASFIKVRDTEDVQNARLAYAEKLWSYAEFCEAQADEDADELQSDEIDDITMLSELTDTKYQYALYYLERAQREFETFKNSDKEEYVTGRLIILGDRIDKINNKRHHLPIQAEVDVAKRDIFILCDKVADRNQSVEEIAVFLEESKVDVNGVNDFNQVFHAIFGLSPNVEMPPLYEAVGSGSFAVVKYLIEELHADIHLFSTKRKPGLLTNINECTSPAVAEYLLESNERFYQNDSEKRLVEFFINCYSGRLEKVTEQLEFDPDSIVKFPESNIDDDSSNGDLALFMALRGNQPHVVRYLEQYIHKYILDNNSIEHTTKLKKLYCGVINCYLYDGWNEQRRETLLTLETQVSDCLEKEIAKLQALPAEELTDDIRITLETYKYELIHMLYTTGRKYELEAEDMEADEEQETENSNLVTYQLASQCYRRVQTDIAKINLNLLKDIKNLDSIVLDMREKATKRIQKIIAKLNVVVDSTDRDEMTDTADDSFIYAEGSFSTSSNMFPTHEGGKLRRYSADATEPTQNNDAKQDEEDTRKFKQAKRG